MTSRRWLIVPIVCGSISGCTMVALAAEVAATGAFVPDQQNLILLGIAIMNAVTAFFAWRTHVQVNIVKKATDGMKDELVAAISDASHAAGVEEGRVAGEQKAATLAEGQLQAKKGER